MLREVLVAEIRVILSGGPVGSVREGGGRREGREKRREEGRKGEEGEEGKRKEEEGGEGEEEEIKKLNTTEKEGIIMVQMNYSSRCSLCV